MPEISTSAIPSQFPEQLPEPPQMPQMPEMPQQPRITPEMLEEMKQLAMQQAVQQVTGTPIEMSPPQPPPQMYAQQQPGLYELPPDPEVVYIRRNFTIAEILLVLAIASGMVVGVQWVWQVGTDLLPRIEIRAK